MKANLYEYLAGNEYPGRGICIGKTPWGSKAMIAYFIMGRSVNSRTVCLIPLKAASAPWRPTLPK